MLELITIIVAIWAYFSPKTKLYKKRWVLVTIVLLIMMVPLRYWAEYGDNKSASEVSKVEGTLEVSKVEGTLEVSKVEGTLATRDVVFESPDGYQILIPKGYTYSKPTGTGDSLLAINDFKDVKDFKAIAVNVVPSNNKTNEQAFDGLRKHMQKRNSTIKFTDPVRLKYGSTEIDRFELTAVEKVGPVRAIMLLASNAGKTYFVDIRTTEKLFFASKPEFERIVSSFSLSQREEKPVATQRSSIPPPQASEVSQPKPVVP